MNFPYCLRYPVRRSCWESLGQQHIRLVASGELPVRRLGGRVYVVTAGLRELVAS